MPPATEATREFTRAWHAEPLGRALIPRRYAGAEHLLVAAAAVGRGASDVSPQDTTRDSFVARSLARPAFLPLSGWPRRVRHKLRVLDELGLVGGVAPWLRTRLGSHGTTHSVKPRHATHPLAYRVGSSDLDVFRQIFIEQEYAPLCDMPEVGVVIDCGANVGYSAAFFLSQFPACRVIAIEPDAGNFDLLERNMRPYGNRVTLVRGGVWSHDAPLTISRARYRDGREWTVQVRPCAAHEAADLRGFGITELCTTFGLDRISLLKMDIEGAEAIVFQGDVEWLARVDAIAIELHDDSSFGRASDIFHAALRGQGFETSRSGELTICRRRSGSR